MLLLVTPVHHLPPPHHQEPAVSDVSGVELEISVTQHHQTRGARPDDLLLVLLHLPETLQLHFIVTIKVQVHSTSPKDFG